MLKTNNKKVLFQLKNLIQSSFLNLINRKKIKTKITLVKNYIK